MASEPTDLIREASAALDGITPGKWWGEVGSCDQAMTVHIPVEGNGTYLFTCVDCGTAAETERDHAFFVADAPDLVRRLRDALEASEFERDRFENARAAAVVKCADVTIERDAARAALAEEQVTVLKFQQECTAQFPDLDDNCGPDEVAAAIHMLRVERNNAFAAIRNMQESNLHREAALAEANATISRVKALADADEQCAATYGNHFDPQIAETAHQAGMSADRIRRAIEGEQA